MSRNHDVTVVIPCFNYGRYVGEAVGSALAQEGGPTRVIVVDDGSDDPATLETLERLPEEVELVRRENGGPAAARNTGGQAAETPFLLFLDADDRLRPGAIADLRKPLEADPGLGYAYGLIENFGDWGGVIRFPDYDPFKLLYRNIVGTVWLMRRDAFEDFGGYDGAVQWMEDWDVLLRALERGWHGRRIPEVAYEYRRHGAARLERDRGAYRRQYRKMRARHAELYRRSGQLAQESGMGAAGRLAYRGYWAWRPLPARLEQLVYGLLFRAAARSTASSTSSASRSASAG